MAVQKKNKWEVMMPEENNKFVYKSTVSKDHFQAYF